MSYVTAPRTFAARIDAEAWLADQRRAIDAKLWNPDTAAKPERITFGDYATGWLYLADMTSDDILRASYERLARRHFQCAETEQAGVGAVTR